MFGISWGEFFVILLVGVLIIPVRMWPEVARFLARVVNMVRQAIWKITDLSEDVKRQIELEKPIDELIQGATNDVLDSFSDVVKKNKKIPKTVRKGRKK